MVWLSGQCESKGYQKCGLSRLSFGLCQAWSSLFSSLCLDTHNAAAFLRLMKSFFIVIIMRCNDACVRTMTCCHGIYDPSDLSQVDICISPQGVQLICWTCTSRVTFNTRYCRCHPLLCSFQLTGSACKPHACMGEDLPEPPASREGMLVALAHEITWDNQLSSDASAWSTLGTEQCFLFPGQFSVDFFPLNPFCSVKDSRAAVVQ